LIADHLFGEGFFPKAAAVYKKALKSRPDHEHITAAVGGDCRRSRAAG
jgi:hypothetical protein